MRKRLFRYFVYFKMGHSNYFAFILSFINFTVIQYRLLISYINPLKLLFTTLTSFTLTFLIVYIPLCIIIGWIDSKVGILPIQGSIAGIRNPWQRDLFKAMYLMCSGKSNEAKRVLEKWIREA